MASLINQPRIIKTAVCTSSTSSRIIQTQWPISLFLKKCCFSSTLLIRPKSCTSQTSIMHPSFSAFPSSAISRLILTWHPLRSVEYLLTTKEVHYLCQIKADLFSSTRSRSTLLPTVLPSTSTLQPPSSRCGLTGS